MNMNNQDKFFNSKSKIFDVWPGGRGSGMKSKLLPIERIVNKGMVGHMSGLAIYLDVNCGNRSTKFTRKQTRKFTNTRWVKKYEKKYSYEVLTPTAVTFKDKIIMHPSIWQRLEIRQQAKTHLMDSRQYGFSGMGRF